METDGQCREQPGRPDQRDTLLTGAVGHVLDRGVATLSLRPLAAALGTSDRMLLYYFGTRDELLVAVLERVGHQLQGALAAAVPDGRLTPEVLLERLWAVLQDDAAEPHLRLYVEVSGLAARGIEPYATAAAAVADGWLAWVGDRLAVDEADRADAAAGVLAVLDGLLLLRFVTSADNARRAGGWLRERLT